jgi:hypothetical protein
MVVLTQFVLRLSFGLALAMGLTSPRKVTSGYFRNHSYVLLGLNVVAVLAALASRGELALWPPVGAAILSYLCAAVWLYEKPRIGSALLVLVALVSLIGAWMAAIAGHDSTLGISDAAGVLRLCDAVTSGLLLGTTMAAMLLGHWYLNTPTMELAPLNRLIALLVAAVVARGIVCAAGLALQCKTSGLDSTQQLMVGLRWASGIVGAAVLIWMARETLRIPNTQSATGILYVAVIATFLGELTSLLLSASLVYPV